MSNLESKDCLTRNPIKMSFSIRVPNLITTLMSVILKTKEKLLS